MAVKRVGPAAYEIDGIKRIEQQPERLGGKWRFYQQRERSWKDKHNKTVKETYWALVETFDTYDAALEAATGD